MKLIDQSLKMIKNHPICDFCLGRQFALLGWGISNEIRGHNMKLLLLFTAHSLILSKNKKGLKILEILYTHGFLEEAKNVLKNNKIFSSNSSKTCYLCENTFKKIDFLVQKAVKMLFEYEYSTFLVGIRIPFGVDEREDEFKASFGVRFGENMRNEFGKLIGAKIASKTGKNVEHIHPDIVVIINPLTDEITLQVNSLYIAGRYQKPVRGIPQTKWFCSICYGKGCEQCNWTGKMYSESVEEIMAEPLLKFTFGSKATLHASGREDVDARMLGNGRPYVMEIGSPKKRFLDWKKMEESINKFAQGKILISDLRLVSKEFVQKLKKSESAQKEYLVIIKFKNQITTENLNLLEDLLSDVIIKQRTPLRVIHRRADLTREKYIYLVKVKKLTSNKAEMRIQCQGGLYIKELVTGDDGRTTPNISEILGNPAEPIDLDVLNVMV